MNKKVEISLLFTLSIIVLIALFVFDVFTGSTNISSQNLIDFFFSSNQLDESSKLIIKEFRLTRVLIAIFAGAALSLAGLLMQSIFNNPLAGPYILGISSGASLGVAMAVFGVGFISPSLSAVLPAWLTVLSAAIGAGFIMLIILFASFRVKDIFYVLILGVLIGAAVSAIVNVLQFFASDFKVKSFVVWGMGSLYSVSFDNLKIIIPILLSSFFIAYLCAKPLNLILFGDDYAISSGVNIKLLKITVFFITSLLAGTVTAFCGPLGFIGVASPHIARWVFKTSNHFILIPASLIIGANILLISDIITHIWVDSNGILPVNAVTAVIGIPFIILIVLKSNK